MYPECFLSGIPSVYVTRGDTNHRGIHLTQLSHTRYIYTGHWFRNITSKCPHKLLAKRRSSTEAALSSEEWQGRGNTRISITYFILYIAYNLSNKATIYQL
uniref:Uncharacterized protein n=1 Tax=Glossina palpalis gambiensis TaxID=67801 RepID=A0A1B0AWH9_9MUSC